MAPAPIHPPPEPTIDMEDPDRTLQIWNIITQSLCISMTTITFALRMYSRIRIQCTVGKEDWICAAAWLGGIGYNITALLMGHYGGGLHRWELSEQSVVAIRKTTYGTMALYGPTAFVTKVAILLILARVFQPYKNLIKFIYVFLGIMGAYYIPVVFLKIFICIPISKFWDKESEGSCLDQTAMVLADAFISVFTDTIILVIPIIGTRPLQMARTKKIRVIGVLGAGGVACAAGIFRLVLIIRDGQTYDDTEAFMRISLWGNAEVSIGIICACLPFITSLVKKAHDQISSKKAGNREYPMDSFQASQCRVTPQAQSNASSTEEESDHNDPVSHAQTNGRIETNIRADTVETSLEQQQQQQRQPYWYEGQGIMKTIDVSHTVSPCRF